MSFSRDTTTAQVWGILDALAAPDEPTDQHMAFCQAMAPRVKGLPPRAVDDVSRDLLAHMTHLVAALPREGGPLELSEAGATYLEQFGDHGSEAAAAVRKNAAKRVDEGGEAAAWLGWHEDCADGPRCRFVETLALVLLRRWKHKAEVEKKKAPAVFGWVHEDRRGLQLRGATLDENVDEGLAVLRSDGVPVASFSIDARTDRERLRQAIRDNLGGGLMFERAWRGLVRMVHQKAIDGVNPCTRLVFNGLGDFSNAVGISSARDQVTVLDLLELLQAWRGNRRDIPPMLTYWLWRASRGRPAQLRIDVGEALAPGYFEGGKVAPPWANRRQKFLVPVLELPNLGFVGNRVRANLAAFQWELLLAMRERIEDYPGGFIFTDIDIERAQDAARVKRADASKAMEVWAAGPKAWLAPKGDGLILADRAAHQLYLRAAQQVRSGRVRGLRRAARQNHPRKSK